MKGITLDEKVQHTTISALRVFRPETGNILKLAAIERVDRRLTVWERLYSCAVAVRWLWGVLS